LVRLRREARERPTYVVVPELRTDFFDRAPLLAAAEHLLTGRKPTGTPVLELYRLHAEGDTGN
jgi:hypothetical protein